MGADNMIIKKAAVHIHDTHQHVFANRGVFVKAPPDFFNYYGSDFTNLSPKEMREAQAVPVRVRTFPEWPVGKKVEYKKEEDEKPTEVLKAAAPPEEKPKPEVVKDVLPKKKVGTSRKVVIR